MIKGLSVIIPNYNGEELLKSNLPYVIEAAYQYIGNNGEIEILVMDDASKDLSIDVLKIFSNKYPFFKFFVNSENVGFGENCNRGVSLAVNDIVLLLNTDVVIEKDFFLKITKFFNSSDIFAVSPLILDTKKGVLGGSYKVPYISRGEIKYEKWRDKKFKRSGAYFTLFCEAGAVAIDRIKFIEIKGFDQIYRPFYYEDVDLCLKAWNKGWVSLFTPEIEVVHNHKSTIGRNYNKNFVKSTIRRNRFIFLWLNLPSTYIFLNHIPNIVLRILSYSLRFDFTYVKGLLEGCRFFKDILKIRKERGEIDINRVIAEIRRDYVRFKGE